jgi:ABC-type transport system involved in cytochrome bd biosynthesis fused ATPase/permease subunit
MLKLLTRLYDVRSGSVKLNGVDVRDLKVEVRLKFNRLIKYTSVCKSSDSAADVLL